MVTIEELKQKSKKECWSKVNYCWHIAGLYVARPLLKTNITPNQITVTWITLQFISFGLMFGNYWYRIAGIVIFNILVTLLDFTDGNIARIKGIKSFRGVYLEYTGLYLGMPLMILALGVGMFVRQGTVSMALLSSFACILMIYEKLLTINPAWFPAEKWKKMEELYISSSISKKTIASTISNLFRKGQPCNVLFLGIVFNYIPATILIYTIVAALGVIRKVWGQYKAISALDR